MGAAEDFDKLYGQVQPVVLTEHMTNREISRILKEASAEAQARIDFLMASGTFSNAVRAEQLRAVQDIIDPLSTALWSQTGTAVTAGMFQQAALAADHTLDRDWLNGMPGLAVAQYSKQIHYDAYVVVNGLASRRDPITGHKLADRIYANGKRSTAVVGRIVDRALVQQLSARELAKQVRHHFDPFVPGGTSYAAMRLARTEINNAHHATTIKLSEDRPWVLGYKWNLSGSHPRPDPCDELAQADPDGLGAGVYGKGNAPSRPHPNCLCYLSHLQEDPDTFVSNLTDGKYDDWLQDRAVRCG